MCVTTSPVGAHAGRPDSIENQHRCWMDIPESETLNWIHSLALKKEHIGRVMWEWPATEEHDMYSWKQQ